MVHGCIQNATRDRSLVLYGLDERRKKGAEEDRNLGMYARSLYKQNKSGQIREKL